MELISFVYETLSKKGSRNLDAKCFKGEESLRCSISGILEEPFLLSLEYDPCGSWEFGLGSPVSYADTLVIDNDGYIRLQGKGIKSRSEMTIFEVVSRFDAVLESVPLVSDAFRTLLAQIFSEPRNQGVSRNWWDSKTNNIDPKIIRSLEKFYDTFTEETLFFQASWFAGHRLGYIASMVPFTLFRRNLSNTWGIPQKDYICPDVKFITLDPEVSSVLKISHDMPGDGGKISTQTRKFVDGIRARLIQHTIEKIDAAFEKATTLDHVEHIHLGSASPIVGELQKILTSKGYLIHFSEADQGVIPQKTLTVSL